ncbi:MAG: flavin reductase [Bacteroidales bacterium]|nr:flavin reductase [Bacteroidales bacterium]
MDTKSLSKIGYGLYVLTTNYDNIDNGCIINTVQQVTSNPLRLSIVVNKNNYTHDLILDSCVFNINVLTTETPFKVFEHFGFQSGRSVNKFAGCEQELRAVNHVLYLPKYINAYFACRMVKSIDLGTHTMFIADVLDAVQVNDKDTVTYDYYQKNIKPKNKLTKGCWVCKVCGWVYEGEQLPDDIVCPLCKHGKEEFEYVEPT